MDQPDVGGEIKQQAHLAFEALHEYAEKKCRKMLFPETDASVFLVVYLKKPTLGHTGKSLRKFITLPFSDRNPSNFSICLILPDFDRSAKAARDPDVDAQARKWVELLQDKYRLTGKHISKIFTITQLCREYSQQADKAKLASTYDIFMVDKKLMRIAINFLGSNFKNKLPLPIDCSKDPSQSLQEAYSLVQLHLLPLKFNITIRIGNLGQPIGHLESNLSVLIDSILQHCPGGPRNIRACYIQTSSTEVSLPIFVDFGSPNEVSLERPKKIEYPDEIGECSTLPDGLAVKVRADGKVTVIDEKTGEEVLYPTEQDEWEREDDIGPLRGKLLERVLKNKAKVVAKKRMNKEKKKKKKPEKAEDDGEKEEQTEEKERKKMKKEEKDEERVEEGRKGKKKKHETGEDEKDEERVDEKADGRKRKKKKPENVEDDGKDELVVEGRKGRKRMNDEEEKADEDGQTEEMKSKKRKRKKHEEEEEEVVEEEHGREEPEAEEGERWQNTETEEQRR